MELMVELSLPPNGELRYAHVQAVGRYLLSNRPMSPEFRLDMLQIAALSGHILKP